MHLTIPAIRVSAPVTAVRQTANGSVGTPPLGEHNLAGWYTKIGYTRGDRPSLIDGHVNGYGQNSVFANLREAKEGRHDNCFTSKRIDRSIPGYLGAGDSKDRLPVGRSTGLDYHPNSGLVTCGGAFDYSTGHTSITSSFTPTVRKHLKEKDHEATTETGCGI